MPGRVCEALKSYFEGDMGAFKGVEVVVRGTAFQEQVWGALRKIPAGRTASYAELAERIGRPTAPVRSGSRTARTPCRS